MESAQETRTHFYLALIFTQIQPQDESHLYLFWFIQALEM